MYPFIILDIFKAVYLIQHRRPTSLYGLAKELALLQDLITGPR